MLRAILRPSVTALATSRSAAGRCLAPTALSYSSAAEQEPAEAPTEDDAEDAGELVTAASSTVAGAMDPAKAIDLAMSRIENNLGLKTHSLEAHFIGLTEALEREQELHLKRLLAAQRTFFEEKEASKYPNMFISEALKASMQEQ